MYIRFFRIKSWYSPINSWCCANRANRWNFSLSNERKTLQYNKLESAKDPKESACHDVQFSIKMLIYMQIVEYHVKIIVTSWPVWVDGSMLYIGTKHHVLYTKSDTTWKPRRKERVHERYGYRRYRTRRYAPNNLLYTLNLLRDIL
jgi:hypothetical protein